jgi:hypothetical protein
MRYHIIAQRTSSPPHWPLTSRMAGGCAAHPPDLVRLQALPRSDARRPASRCSTRRAWPAVASWTLGPDQGLRPRPRGVEGCGASAARRDHDQGNRGRPVLPDSDIHGIRQPRCRRDRGPAGLSQRSLNPLSGLDSLSETLVQWVADMCDTVGSTFQLVMPRSLRSFRIETGRGFGLQSKLSTRRAGSPGSSQTYRFVLT